MSKKSKYKSECRKKQSTNLNVEKNIVKLERRKEQSTNFIAERNNVVKFLCRKNQRCRKNDVEYWGNSLYLHFVYPEIVFNLTRQIEPAKTPIPVGLRKYKGMAETMDREGPWKC